MKSILRSTMETTTMPGRYGDVRGTSYGAAVIFGSAG
jgi:hypothetical protein